MEEWGAFRHKGNAKADYMKKAATTALLHVFYTLPYVCLLEVPTCYGMEVRSFENKFKPKN